MAFTIRRAQSSDENAIRSLYKTVAETSLGLARRSEEITPSFVKGLILESNRAGLILILEGAPEQALIGMIHATHGELKDLRHVMGHLTILIHPAFQKQGYAKRLFSAFLLEVQLHFPFILRVELRARESSDAALGLYKSLGFVSEGLFQSRIRRRNGTFEDGIPMVWFNPRWTTNAPEEHT